MNRYFKIILLVLSIVFVASACAAPVTTDSNFDSSSLYTSQNESSQEFVLSKDYDEKTNENYTLDDGKYIVQIPKSWLMDGNFDGNRFNTDTSNLIVFIDESLGVNPDDKVIQSYVDSLSELDDFALFGRPSERQFDGENGFTISFTFSSSGQTVEGIGAVICTETSWITFYLIDFDPNVSHRLDFQHIINSFKHTSDSPSSTAHESSDSLNTIGDTVQNEIWKITVVDAKLDSDSAEGTSILYIFLDVENISEDEERFSSAYTSGYEDSYKNKMIISVKDIEDYDSIIAASVLPGKKAKFYASFEVDPDFKLFEFVYDDGGILQFQINSSQIK